MNRSACPAKRAWRILFVLAAFLLPGSVQAEWFQFGRTEVMRLYLDQKLIRKNGDFAQMLQLMDFTTSQWVDGQTVVGSLKVLIEYDCSRPRSRPLTSEAFSEQMGDGRMVSKEQFPDPQWEVVEPGTTADKIRQIACGKK